MRKYTKDKYFYELDIDSFIEKIKLSEKRRPQYFKGITKYPKKYRSEDYEIDKNGILIHVETGEKVIKNIRTVGTPNVKMITGQYFWTGAHPHIRRKIKREMSEFFYKYMKDIPMVREHQYPIGVRIDLYDVEDSGQD